MWTGDWGHETWGHSGNMGHGNNRREGQGQDMGHGAWGQYGNKTSSRRRSSSILVAVVAVVAVAVIVVVMSGRFSAQARRFSGAQASPMP